MKKFIFRLETLLALRKTNEGALKRDLEVVSKKFNQTKEQQESLKMQIAALTQEMQKKLKEGKLDLQDMHFQILDHLNALLADVEKSFVVHQKQMEEQKERFKRAIQERKVIEKIKEKHYASWRMREARLDGALLDEIALKKPIDTQ